MQIYRYRKRLRQRKGSGFVKEIRYRTEAFSGTKERDAAEVMAFETFQLGNTDILEHISQHYLRDSLLQSKCSAFIRELDDNGYVDDMGMEDQVGFFHELLEEIEHTAGVPIKYALWLADKAVVCDQSWYGYNMTHDEDFECYEVGPVILSDLGHDGTLYGYTELPVSLEDRFCELTDDMADIMKEREKTNLSPEKASYLNIRFHEVSSAIHDIEEVLIRKSEPSPVAVVSVSDADMQRFGARAEERVKASAKDAFPSLASQIQVAEDRCRQVTPLANSIDKAQER